MPENVFVRFQQVTSKILEEQQTPHSRADALKRIPLLKFTPISRTDLLTIGSRIHNKVALEGSEAKIQQMIQDLD